MLGVCITQKLLLAGGANPCVLYLFPSWLFESMARLATSANGWGGLLNGKYPPD